MWLLASINKSFNYDTRTIVHGVSTPNDMIMREFEVPKRNTSAHLIEVTETYVARQKLRKLKYVKE